MKTVFTSESVTEGHPDKICDRISDAVLDELLRTDSGARCACETLVKDNRVVLAGEITSTARPDYEKIVRRVVDDIGYTPDCGFSSENLTVELLIREQSPDIALGVDRSLESKSGEPQELGAGDQGMMFGYACDETAELMPLPVSLAHALCRRLMSLRKGGALPYLRPDGKAQVTVEYDDNKPVRVEAVVLSSQHSPYIDMETLRSDLKKHAILSVIPPSLIDRQTKIYINPTGRFVVGGPVGDSGVTGRKIIVDSYGGIARHGGGCFSGKDATKVDRSAAYMARYIAKNIVAAGIASECEIQLAYAIGVAQPVSIMVDCFGSSKYKNTEIARAVAAVFPLTPSRIIEHLRLTKPIFESIMNYGHFGRSEPFVLWERTDKTDELLRQLRQ